MAYITATPLVNAAIARARSLPDLLASLPPALAAQLETKPLLASKSPPAVFLATLLTWLSARFGLGWDETTCALIAGAVMLVVGYMMRAVTKQPTAGIITTPPAAPTAATSNGLPTAIVLLMAAAATSVVSACTANQVTAAIATGQLFCAAGPTVVALVDPSLAPVLAKGNTAAYVQAACKAFDTTAVPVSPPASGSPVPTVTITPPPVTLKLSWLLSETATRVKV